MRHRASATRPATNAPTAAAPERRRRITNRHHRCKGRERHVLIGRFVVAQATLIAKAAFECAPAVSARSVGSQNDSIRGSCRLKDGSWIEKWCLRRYEDGDALQITCSASATPRGVVRTAGLEPALPKEADFRTTSAFAAAPRGVRGLDYPFTLAPRAGALGAARLVSTPSWVPGLARDWHGAARPQSVPRI